MRKENHAKIARIVIPVVVGSNPISHPIHPSEDFVFFVIVGRKVV
jgi:hypothetical protein